MSPTLSCTIQVFPPTSAIVGVDIEGEEGVGVARTKDGSGTSGDGVEDLHLLLTLDDGLGTAVVVDVGDGNATVSSGACAARSVGDALLQSKVPERSKDMSMPPPETTQMRVCPLTVATEGDPITGPPVERSRVAVRSFRRAP
ncbi:MAG: hypothetical protein R2697_08010 [Ilumatobacteraceae bacterium]